MLVEIICEYLNEIGILELNHINEFLSIFKQLEPKNSTKGESIDKIKQALFFYIKKILKEEIQISNLCENIINSFLNTRIVSKYKQLNSIINIIKTKIFCHYIYFFSKLINCKNNKKTNKSSYKSLKNNKNNTNSVFYNTFRHEMHRNNSITTLIKQYNKNINTHKSIFNDYISQRNQKLNNNDIKTYSHYTPFINISQKYPHIFENNSNFLNNSYYTPDNYYEKNNFIFNDNNSKSNIPINPNSNYTNDSIYNTLPIQFNSNNDSYYDPYDNFLQNEEKHIQKVRDKIVNMKMENFSKIEKECTFSPKIHSYHPRNNIIPQNNNILVYDSNQKNRTFNKIKNIPSVEYHIDSPNNSHININNDNNKSPKLNKNNSYSIYDRQRDEILKEQISRFTFAPKITYNDKYKVNTTFEERRIKSIEKNKQKDYELKKLHDLKSKKHSNKSKNKEIIDRLYTKELKKIKDKKKSNSKNKTKPVINWEKRYKDSLNKYTDSKNYKKKILTINNNKNKNNNSNKKEKVFDFQQFTGKLEPIQESKYNPEKKEGIQEKEKIEEKKEKIKEKEKDKKGNNDDGYLHNLADIVLNEDNKNESVNLNEEGKEEYNIDDKKFTGNFTLNDFVAQPVLGGDDEDFEENNSLKINDKNNYNLKPESFKSSELKDLLSKRDKNN